MYNAYTVEEGIEHMLKIDKKHKKSII